MASFHKRGQIEGLIMALAVPGIVAILLILDFAVVAGILDKSSNALYGEIGRSQFDFALSDWVYNSPSSLAGTPVDIQSAFSSWFAKNGYIVDSVLCEQKAVITCGFFVKKGQGNSVSDYDRHVFIPTKTGVRDVHFAGRIVT